MTSRTKIQIAGLLGVAIAALPGLSLAGCGGRSSLEGLPLGKGGPSGGTAATGMGGMGGAGGAGTGYGGLPPGMAPTPHCTGSNSQCIIPEAGGPVKGAATIHCDPEPIKGPWNLLLERQTLTGFEVVQMQAVQEPGFGATFYDTMSPPVELTYRVCVSDMYGTRCGDPFHTFGPVDCACEPFTCDLVWACDITIGNGCGGTLHCGGCTGGMPCNTKTHSCCPPGEESDGIGGCVCAPSKPCPPAFYWNVVYCDCEPEMNVVGTHLL